MARIGNFGAFLLDEPETMMKLVSTLYHGLKIPVTCKIRILDDLE